MVGWRLVAVHEDVGLAVKRRSFWLEEECIDNKYRSTI